MIRSFKYRIYPTVAQQKTLIETLAICCELYNAALQERRDAWKLERKSISWFDQNLQIKEIRKVRPDVSEVYNKVLQETLHRVHLAFAGYFRRLKAGARAGYPRFRSASRYDSIVFRDVGQPVRGNKLRLPKIGSVRLKLHRPLEGSIRTLTVKREAGRWVAVFSCEVISKPLPHNPSVIGIDVGLNSFAALSDGQTIENPRWYRMAESSLRTAQRRVARRQKGSHRRRKAVALLQRAYIAVRNQRADFQHKLSRRLVNENGLIAVEDLNVKGLAAGILSKSINDAGWSNFINMLSYKAENAGRLLIKVDPRGTSQTCLCGATVRKMLRDREHVCTECGLVADRDHVSAQIILGRGLRLQALTSPVAECVA